MDEIKKAKLRALHILTKMDKTEADLRAGLKRTGFSDEAIDESLEYVKSFGYIDDKKYAEKYVSYNKDRKSRQKIRFELLNKGVSKEDIDAAIENCEDFQELEVLKRFLHKKWKKEEKPNEKELSRLYASLARQGFASCDIWKVLQEENLT